MRKPSVTVMTSSGGESKEELSGPIMAAPASAKLNGALESDPPRCRFKPKVELINRVGEAV